MPQLVSSPEADSSRTSETLAYLDAYDAVLNDDYAFVAYKEADKSSADWRVRIVSRHTSGAVFEPEAMRLQARSAHAQNKCGLPGLQIFARTRRSTLYRISRSSNRRQTHKHRNFCSTEKSRRDRRRTAKQIVCVAIIKTKPTFTS